MRLTLQQAATQLGKTPRQVHYMIRTGKLAAIKDGAHYMDDFALFARSRAQLVDAQAAIAGWLASERRLELKAFPVHVHRSDEPHEFLGWRLAPGAARPGSKIRRRMSGKLRLAAARGPAALGRSIAAYRALWELWDAGV